MDVSMTMSLAQLTGGVTDHLADDEIHVWELRYAAADRRAPLQRVLAAYLGVDAADVALEENEHGRPAFATAHASAIDFNWSHSADRALIAIGHDVSLGIDIEQLRERPRALDIAERYFSADEAASLRAVVDDERAKLFLELWTAKEAVLKALGRGIAFGLHRLSISINCDRLDILRLEGENLEDWRLRRLMIEASSVAALAWRGGARRITQFHLPTEHDARAPGSQ
jgi:4'-phosphopantetheinyl transferase